MRNLTRMREKIRALEKTIKTLTSRRKMTTDNNKTLDILPDQDRCCRTAIRCCWSTACWTWEANKSITAIKNVTVNEEFFNGHFPHKPVMPGVLMIEALAQTAAMLSFLTMGVKPDENSVVYFVGIDNARFKRPVGPGDQLKMDVEILRVSRGIWKYKAVGTVDGEAGAGSGTDVHHPQQRRREPASGAVNGGRSTPRAIIDPKAELDSSVEVGPYSIIGPHVRIGAGTVVGPHVVIEGHTTIGSDNKFFQFSSIGARRRTRNGRASRPAWKSATATPSANSAPSTPAPCRTSGVTRLGNDNWISAYVHLAHDCQVGSNTIFSNNAQLAGHVEIGDWVDHERLRRRAPVLQDRRACLRRHEHQPDAGRAAVRAVERQSGAARTASISKA